MTKGNSAMQEKEEEIRMGNLELAEVQRRLAAVHNFSFQKIPKWFLVFTNLVCLEMCVRL